MQHPQNQRKNEGGWRTRDLLDKPARPTCGRLYCGPEPEGVCKDNPDSNVRVVERLEVDRVEVWEAKDDRDEGDPEHDGDRDWVQALAEAEGFLIDPRR
jgi:hypothetical protein